MNTTDGRFVPGTNLPGTRREFFKTVGFGVGAAALGCAALSESHRLPNILIIHTDQHRIDCLGAYGNEDVKTPHIDRLAENGVTFKNSFCPFPVCTPSRYSLLCGQYVHDHNGWGNRSTLSPGIETFPRILRAAGYRTKAVGKMHFTPTYLDVGFSEMVLSEQDGPGRWDDDYHRYLMRNGLVDFNDLEDQRREYRDHASDRYWKTFGALVSNLDEKHHSTTWIGDQAFETLDRWDGEGGQLLMAGFIKPHHPFDPPAPWHEMYDPDTLRLLPGWIENCLDRDLNYGRGYFPNDSLNEQALRRAMAYYYASISQIDYQVGRLIECLEKKGLYRNTLIVYTADHGEYMGFHHMLLKGNFMYDPLVKVPLIIKWPGNERAGTVTDRLVNNIDLAPTLCRAAGCEPGMKMKGLDLRQQGDGREMIFAEARGGNQVMARSGKLKLIKATHGKQNLEFLYDLENDPLEMKNVYKDVKYRDASARLEAALDAWRHNGPAKSFADHGAPLIKQANVPAPDLSHRDEIIAYYKKKMQAQQGQ